MLNKLLKYDLKYMIKNMFIFYILTIFFAILARVLSYDNAPMIVIIIKHIFLGTMYSMMFSILFNTVIRSWIRFNDSLYKDESYLTHTLPVTKNNIYDAKFIQTLIFFIIGFIIIVIGLFIAFYTKDNWLILKAFVNKMTTGLNFSTSFFIIGFLSVIFLEVFNAIQCGFLGIILGHKRNNNKIAFSFLFGFIVYLLSQGIVLLFVFITGLFESSIMDLFKNSVILNSGGLKKMIIIASIIYIVVIIIMNLLCKKELNKGVNIE